MTARWQFWIDRGGTFTDIVARTPDGDVVARKVLSDHPTRPTDAAIAGIRSLTGIAAPAPLPLGLIDTVRLGTTVATNALLERRGEPTLLVITAGFGDVLRIGTQARPDLFSLDIVRPADVYADVVEVHERVDADGSVVIALDEDAARVALARAHATGLRAVAIVCMHGDRHPAHERALARLAAEVGFTQVSTSHEVSPLPRIVPRGDTTSVDAYLSPVLGRHVDRLAAELPDDTRLLCMQSHGGLTSADRFRGRDALLSGPAGGVVGMVETARAAGFDRVVGFDMGGTSTDVAHCAGRLERADRHTVAGIEVRAPMLEIHTVAAGGGSILHVDGARLRVGPDSAGADPGPACYGNGGPATITDANLVLGRVRAAWFPRVFGPRGDAPLDQDAARAALDRLATAIGSATGRPWAAEEAAAGFVEIAVDNMANAVKRISVQRGQDIADHTLVCFGGAGGQHACAVADRLGIDRVLVDPLAGVLSAVGIGMAALRHVVEHAVGDALSAAMLRSLTTQWSALVDEATAAIVAQGRPATEISIERRIGVRLEGSDTVMTLTVEGDVSTDPTERAEAAIRTAFADAHRAHFGYAVPRRPLIVDVLSVEAVAPGPGSRLGSGGREANRRRGARTPVTATMPGGGPDRPRDAASPLRAWFDGAMQPTPFLPRSSLVAGRSIPGPAVIVDDTATTVIDPGWTAVVGATGELVVTRTEPRPGRRWLPTEVDPVQLEIFDNLFMSVAEQMGVVLERTAVSVNIKERLDFSCAIFDDAGELVANAPHVPVHLGSMGDAVQAVIARHPHQRPGDVFVTNAPYAGGTHLPDITVVAPVFVDPGSGDTSGAADTARASFYVAARGHHADIGGTSPGSAPARSTSILDEGVLLDGLVLVRDGELDEAGMRAVLTDGPHPARDPEQNLADLAAQVAACARGDAELRRLVERYGIDVVHAYMGHVADHAEESVRRVIVGLDDGACVTRTDDGHEIHVALRVDRRARRAVVDFTGTAPSHPGNFNAPLAVCKAAVLYVFRCLIAGPVPLNAGALRPIEIVVPTPSMLAPEFPAAVFAGNVETSQLVVDALFGAIGVVAGSQGTMNNLIVGDDRHQYYETICGGAGATATADGASGVHTHMTNSRLTDPEILELRHPVRVEHFGLRRGSGGRGLHRGGDGVVRRLRLLAPMHVDVVSSRRVEAPPGLDGGGDGAIGRNRVIGADGSITDIGGVASLDLLAGDTIEIATPGGGGWGESPRT